MRVLLTNHTSLVSGGERALLDLVTHLPGEVSPVVACPAGPLAGELRRAGVPVADLPGTAGSLRLHPVRTPVALAQLAHAGTAIRRLARRHRARLVHANSLRAGLSGVVAARLGGPPLVVHMHDARGPGPVAAASVRAVAGTAAAILANSRYTAQSLGLADGAPPVRVVHNPVDLARFALATGEDRDRARRELGVPADAAVLCQVAQLTPWKAQDDAIRATALLRDRGAPAHLLLAGSAKFVARATRYDNRAFEQGLRELVAALDLADRVHFLGEVAEPRAVYAASDVALLPSWAEPFGLAVIEAMAAGTPVVATAVGGPREILQDGRLGLLAPPREPAAWAAAAGALLADPARRARLRDEGARHVRDAFGVEAYAARVVAAYAEASA